MTVEQAAVTAYSRPAYGMNCLTATGRFTSGAFKIIGEYPQESYMATARHAKENMMYKEENKKESEGLDVPNNKYKKDIQTLTINT